MGIGRSQWKLVRVLGAVVGSAEDGFAEAPEGGEAAPVAKRWHGADRGACASVVERAVGGELLLHEGLAPAH